MKPPEKTEIEKTPFTGYQKFVIAILAILQFTIILDFMVLSPLGTILMDELSLSPSRFGIVVSAYAFSAGISGLLAAGFADRFDRKKMLLFFYTGFLLGTFFCAMAPTFELLLIARIVTGIFGGVIGSIGFAIITDLFPMQKRGRVMGFVQMAFSASQILGLPIGLYLANELGWHSPFWMIALFGVVVGLVIYFYLKPIDTHLQVKSEVSAFQHLWKTLTNRDYIRGFLATVLLATGGWMLMPFGSRFTTNNLGIAVEDLPMIYLITGISSIIAGPLIGKFSDVSGKFNMFLFGSILSIVMVAIYTPLGITPLWLVILLNVILFVGISARIITSSALLTAVPLPQDRGAFMSINSSIQQLSGGVASTIAGMIVIPDANDRLLHYDILGYVVIGSILVALWMMHLLNKHIQKTAVSTVR
jgi:multidrug resistance protein